MLKQYCQVLETYQPNNYWYVFFFYYTHGCTLCKIYTFFLCNYTINILLNSGQHICSRLLDCFINMIKMAWKEGSEYYGYELPGTKRLLWENILSLWFFYFYCYIMYLHLRAFLMRAVTLPLPHVPRETLTKVGVLHPWRFTPLKIYNGTPEGCLTRDSRATLPINELKRTLRVRI